MRRASGLLALQLHAGPPMTVQFRNSPHQAAQSGEGGIGNGQCENVTVPVLFRAADKSKTKKIVLIAGRKSHGYGAHEHKAGCMLAGQGIE